MAPVILYGYLFIFILEMKIEKTIKLNGENENVYKEYEPGTIQSVFGSINSYLRDINYGCDLRVDPKFYHT